MPTSVKTHLMFEGDAEDALNFYDSLFEDAEILDVQRFGPEAGEHAGEVLLAQFRIGEHRFQFANSTISHEFTFTPSMSIFIDLEDADRQEELFEKLSEDGNVMMPLDDYGFSTRFAWVSDRFGVSWQLNLP